MQYAGHTPSDFRRFVAAAGLAAASPLLPSAGRPLPGGGTEVTGLRDYAPGDDFRYIDWTLCARRDEILSKCFAGQEDRRFYVLVDCSRSMAIGSPRKFDLARRIAGLLGSAALVRGDSVVGTAFSNRPTFDTGPLCGGQFTLRWLRTWEQLSIVEPATDIAAAAEAFVRRRQRPGAIAVLSDFYDRQGATRGLEILRNGGYEPRAVQIIDPCEAEAPLAGDLALCDVEGGPAMEFTLTESMRRAYRTAYQTWRTHFARACRQQGWPCLQLSTATPWAEIYRVLVAGKMPPTPTPLLQKGAGRPQEHAA